MKEERVLWKKRHLTIKILELCGRKGVVYSAVEMCFLFE